MMDLENDLNQATCDPDKVKELFNKRCFKLSWETIVQISEEHKSFELNNVIVGLLNECFGLIADGGLAYNLFYVNGKQFKGDLIELSVEDEMREELVMMFAYYLSAKYDELEPVNIFNTFQTHTRSYLEGINRLTISSIEFERQKNLFQNFEILAPGVNGIHIISMLDKGEFYQQFFCALPEEFLDTSNYVYLMLNKKTNLIKIGTSERPSFRERTLQSQEPEVILIAAWNAPRSIEKYLHNKFKKLRSRGEWFSLKFKDLNEIKTYMNQFLHK
jgi:hypothetical protein